MMAENPRPNPYVGPRAFREGEPFYGRSRERRQLFQLLVARRIALLHSPSGAGKTSLVQAGLVPELKEDGFNVLPVGRLNMVIGGVTGGDSSVNRYVSSLLLSLEERPAEQFDASLAGLSLADYLASRYGAEEEPELTVLIIDQFEEILTLDPTDTAAKIAFFSQVGDALSQPNIWALFAIREDYLGALEPYVRAIPTRLANTFRLDLLGAAAAREAIRKPPVEQHGVHFTEAALETLVDDLRQTKVQQPDGGVVQRPGPYVEPVQLQVVCHNLWKGLAPEQTEISEADLQSVGDVDQSLAAYYAEQVNAASAHPELAVTERAVRRWVQDKLITKDGIRVPVLRGHGQTEGLDNRVLKHLEDAHLVRADKRAGMTWYELAHDRLVQPVTGNNAGWFSKHLSTLQRQAQRWREEGEADYLLLRDQDLSDAEAWAADHPDAMSADDRAFLEASRKEWQREEESRQAKIREVELQQQTALAEEQRLRAEEATGAAARQSRLTRIALTMLGLTLIAACLASVFFVTSQRNAEQAEKNAEQAEAARQDAVTALAIAEAAEQVAREQADLAATSAAQAISQGLLAQQSERNAYATAQAADMALEQARATVAFYEGEPAMLATPTPTPRPGPVGVTPLPAPPAVVLDFEAIQSELDQGQAVAHMKFGFFTASVGNNSGLTDYLGRLSAAGVPAVLTVTDADLLVEAQQLVRQYGVEHTLVYANLSDPSLQVPDYNLPPDQAAEEHWQRYKEALPPELDPELVWLQTINEPDPSRVDWLGEFAVVTAKLMLADGYRWAAFGWSAGEPERDAWMSRGMQEFLVLALTYPDQLAIAVHEYSFTNDDIQNFYPQLIGRFQYIFQLLNEMGYGAKPTIIVSEWGWELTSIPSQEKALADMAWAAGLYAMFPEVKGAAMWTLLPGWGNIDKQVQALIDPLTERTLGCYFVVRAGWVEVPVSPDDTAELICPDAVTTRTPTPTPTAPPTLTPTAPPPPRPTATPTTPAIAIQTKTDLRAFAPRAIWTNGSGGSNLWRNAIPGEGDSSASQGFAAYLTTDKFLETGNLNQDPRTLYTHPQFVPGGEIRGTFRLALPPEGARLFARFAFLDGADSSDGVRVEIWWRKAGAANAVQLAEDLVGDNGSETNRDIDMRAYAGETGDLILVVNARDNSSQDWLTWTALEVEPWR